MHDLAIVKGENEMLLVHLEQSKGLYDGAMEDNRNLRNDLDHVKTAMQRHDKVRDDVS